MPVIDYQCACGAVDSAYYPLAEWPYPETVPCPKCNATMERNWMSGPTTGFSPIVVHVSESGEVSIPGHRDDPVDEGYRKVEITSMRQYERFRRGVEQREKEKAQFLQAASDAFFDDVLQEHRASRQQYIEEAIRKGGHTVQYEDEYGTVHQRWAPITERARQLFELSCKYTDKVREERRKRLASNSPNFHSRILELRESERSVVDGEAKRAEFLKRRS